MTPRTKPRRTRAVREGWAEIRAYITCELESGEAQQFDCREWARRLCASYKTGEEPERPDASTCPCEGCTAARKAFAAIAWIDARL
jgi:hypothetical protein